SAAPRSVVVVGEDARFDAYAEALRWAVEGDLGAIVLVPEISQAERMAAWVARHAGAQVVLLTGDVPEHRRWHDWRRILAGEVRAEAGPLGGLFGRRLYQALARTLPRGRAIMFVPRRGYADFLLCHECGTVPRCPWCGVALTYHKDRSGPGGGRPGTAARVALRCHLCNRTEPVPEVC